MNAAGPETPSRGPTQVRARAQRCGLCGAARPRRRPAGGPGRRVCAGSRVGAPAAASLAGVHRGRAGPSLRHRHRAAPPTGPRPGNPHVPPVSGPAGPTPDHRHTADVPPHGGLVPGRGNAGEPGRGTARTGRGHPEAVTRAPWATGTTTTCWPRPTSGAPAPATVYVTTGHIAGDTLWPYALSDAIAHSPRARAGDVMVKYGGGVGMNAMQGATQAIGEL